VDKEHHTRPETDGDMGRIHGSKATMKELALKLTPFVIGALLLAGLIASHLLFGLRPQH
jgi:hypothetical protein